MLLYSILFKKSYESRNAYSWSRFFKEYHKKMFASSQLSHLCNFNYNWKFKDNMHCPNIKGFKII